MLVKLEGQREAKITPFEEVKKDLAKELVQEEKVGALAQKMAEQLKAKVTETNDLKKAVDALKAEMVEKSGGRMTSPQIFIDGQHVGGSDDIHALDRDGKLDPLLTA